MDPFNIISLIMSVLMGGAGMVSQAKANQQNIEYADKAREDAQAFAAREAERARQANIDQYNMLYSPQAKVRQFKEAGLSPALMYSGGAAGGQGVSTQMASSPSSGLPTINPIIQQSGLLDLFQQSAETEKTKSETASNIKGIELMEQQIKESNAAIQKIEADIKNTDVSTMNMKLQNDLLEIRKKYENASLDDQIEMVKEQKKLVEKNVEEAMEKIRGMQIENSKKEEFINAEIRKMNAEIIKIGKESLLIQQQTLVAKAEEQLKQAQKRLTNKQTLELTEKIRIVKVQADKIEQAPWTAESSGWIDKLINIGIDGCNELIREFKQLGISIEEGVKNAPGWVQSHRNDRIGAGKVF